MQEIINDKIAVLVHGAIHSNCTSDLECPEQTTCVIGASWSAFPSMCTCSITVSRWGDSCENLTDSGKALFALCLIAFCITAATSLILGYDAYKLLQARVKITFSALQTTLLFLGIASICLQTYLMLAMIDQFIPFIVVKRGTGEFKLSSPTFVASNVFLAFTFFFETLGLLNISLVWVDIASATSAMSPRTQHNIQRFRVGLGIYYFFFGGAVILFVILDRVLLVVFVVIPPIAFLLTTYIWGYFKMSQAAKSTSVGKTSSSDVAANDTTSAEWSQNKQSKDVKRAIRRMAKTAFGLVLFGGLGVLCLIIQTSVNLTNINTPSTPFTIIVNRIAWICFAASLMVGAVYIHPLVLNSAARGPRNVSRVRDQQVTVPPSSNMMQPSSALSFSHVALSDAVSPPNKKRSLTAMMPKDAKQGLDVILNEESGELRERFTEFIRLKYASDALDLYDACTRYKECALKQGVDKIEIANLGQSIIREYIREDAPHAVDMAHALRAEIVAETVKGDFKSSTFEKARNMAFNLLKVNFYHQFQKTLEIEEGIHNPTSAQ